MVSTPVFSNDFYRASLFCQRERAYVTADNTIAVTSKETLCDRVKRFFTFEQDPYFDQVHNKLAEISRQITQKSGLIYSSLVKEAHERGEIGLEYLEENVSRLRDKFDKVGQLNCFSQLTLKVLNFFRAVFGLSPIAIKKYATVTYELADPIWAGNIFPGLGLSRYIESSFSPRIDRLQNPALSLTEEDRRSCAYRAESTSPTANEAIQKLQRGLLKTWRVGQNVKSYHSIGADGRVLMGTEQVLGNLDINFNKERQTFSVAIHNPRCNERISSKFKRFLEETPLADRTISYRIQIKDAQGHIENEELTWQIAPSGFRYHLNLPSELIKLELNKQYTFFDGAKELASFTLRTNQTHKES